jgi:HAD superfamily hydrolase (TIGR01509 family)
LTEPFAPEALVLDMDGLLLDTERIALETFELACRANNFGVDREVYFQCIGSNGAGTRAILLRALGNGFPYDRISKDWAARYHERVMTKPVDLKAGAIELLELVQRLGLPVALATSTRTELANTKLRLAGLDRFFAAVIGGDAVTHGKPHPEPYLAATRLLGRSPSACWAVEDSDAGVRAAHGAGLFVLQVPDLVQPSAAVRSLGHAVVDSLHDVSRLLSMQVARRSVT